VTIVAVFLAYNANSGLPFVPTYELEVNLPNGAQLVPGNEIREGGHRIGTVTEITPTKLKDGTTGAKLLLQLDADAGPVPADSTIRVRPRSALGLKYVELHRGTARDTFPEGATITAGPEALAPELQDFFNLFDDETRTNVTNNLNEFGNAFAGRGLSLNQAFESLPRFLEAVPPVMGVLRDPDTRLLAFFSELEDAARISAPLAETMADGFRAGAQTFSALARDPAALQETIAETPPTLEVGTRALANTRPFLNSLADVSGDLRLAAGELRRSAPPIRVALASGIEPLQQTPALNRRLSDTFGALTSLARSPGSDTGVSGLTETMTTLRPLTRYLGPYVTVCNYWNYSWTYLADHITDQDQTGQIQRVRAKQADGEQMPLGSYGQGFAVPGLHAQPYGAAVDAAGNADCEQGQRGYPTHLANGIDPSRHVVGEPVTPGNQGTTYTGIPSVPKGQTFTSVPEGLPGIDPGELRP
jgi:phospholipid/cholesterol/gamma-HCH transport system substrate-binding protein